MKRLGKLMSKVLFVGLALGVPVLALAVPSFGDIGNNIKDSSGGLGGAVYSFGLLAGIVLVVGSIIIFATHKKSQTPLSIPAIMFIAGLLLVSLTALIDSGTQSTFGSSTSELNKLLK